MVLLISSHSEYGIEELLCHRYVVEEDNRVHTMQSLNQQRKKQRPLGSAYGLRQATKAVKHIVICVDGACLTAMHQERQ